MSLVLETEYALPVTFRNEPPAEPEPLWVSSWRDSHLEIAIVGTMLAVLGLVMLAQEWIVRRPRLLALRAYRFFVLHARRSWLGSEWPIKRGSGRGLSAFASKRISVGTFLIDLSSSFFGALLPLVSCFGAGGFIAVGYARSEPCKNFSMILPCGLGSNRSPCLRPCMSACGFSNIRPSLGSSHCRFTQCMMRSFLPRSNRSRPPFLCG